MAGKFCGLISVLAAWFGNSWSDILHGWSPLQPVQDVGLNTTQATGLRAQVPVVDHRRCALRNLAG